MRITNKETKTPVFHPNHKEKMEAQGCTNLIFVLPCRCCITTTPYTLQARMAKSLRQRVLSSPLFLSQTLAFYSHNPNERF
uniref:Uncharacterized protein n=1 Tax=Arundo donax TaxID=35708 RepID=A0A0A9BTW1_ARUDO